MRVELMRYWDEAKVLNMMRQGAAPASQERIEDAQAELEAMFCHTKWPRLRYAAGMTLQAAAGPAEGEQAS